MKAAYIHLAMSDNIIGHQKKIKEKITASRALGYDLDFYYINIHNKRPEIYHPDLKIIELSENVIYRNLLRFHRCTPLKKYINFKQYDAVILRYPFADFSIFSSFFNDPDMPCIITEHHTKEVDELSINAQSILKPAYYYQGLSKKMERYIGPLILRNHVDAICAVTNEIKEYEIERSDFTGPSVAICNGVGVADIPLTPPAPYTGEQLNLIFSASVFSPWQGLDRLLEGMKRYRRTLPVICLNLIGHLPGKYRDLIDELNKKDNTNIRTEGTIYNPEKFRKFFLDSHLGVSVLSLHKKNMIEACPIKTREYTAMGIPFIMGYDDPDLPENENFFMKIAPDNSPVDIDNVIEFAKKILAERGVADRMRLFAENNMDWSIKMKNLWDFVGTIC